MTGQRNRIVVYLAIEGERVGEQEIIEKCLRGDRKAQRMLFERFAGRMMTICRRYAGNQADAEDMLQDSFIRVFSYLHQYRQQGSFEGWLRRLVVHTCLRSLSRRADFSGLDDISPSQEPAVQPIALDWLSEEEILHLIAEMPAGYRTIFNLSVLDGFSHKEIAAVAGIDESTSRTQLLKARKWIQRRLEAAQKIHL